MDSARLLGVVGTWGTRDHALANAAFTSYVGLRNFRDFKLEVEAGSVEPNVRVGLWAKVSGH